MRRVSHCLGRLIARRQVREGHHWLPLFLWLVAVVVIVVPIRTQAPTFRLLLRLWGFLVLLGNAPTRLELLSMENFRFQVIDSVIGIFVRMESRNAKGSAKAIVESNHLKMRIKHNGERNEIFVPFRMINTDLQTQLWLCSVKDGRSKRA
jgi:hypothetical protein